MAGLSHTGDQVFSSKLKHFLLQGGWRLANKTLEAKETFKARDTRKDLGLPRPPPRLNEQAIAGEKDSLVEQPACCRGNSKDVFVT